MVRAEALIQQARKSFLVTDISKLERSAPVRIIPMSEVDSVFVDAPLPPDLARQCVEWGTQVIVAPPRR